MEFTVTENVPGMLIFINFQKAIDSLELDFIFGCVEAFNKIQFKIGRAHV